MMQAIKEYLDQEDERCLFDKEIIFDILDHNGVRGLLGDLY